jgi:sec-independent protein translocase protein TatB
MDSFFGIGLSELIAILILAGLVMGPQRIRQVARTLGQWTAVLQRYARQFTRQLNSELDAMDMGDLRDMRDEILQLRRQVTSLQDDLRTEGRKFAQGTRDITQETRNIIDPRQVIDTTTEPNPLPKPLAIDEDPSA